MCVRSKATHTPGPWSYDGHGINCAAEEFKGDRIFKTCLDYSYNSPSRDRAIADSNLVAAAPELLEALETILGEIDENECSAGMSVRIGQAKAIIAKARPA